MRARLFPLECRVREGCPRPPQPLTAPLYTTPVSFLHDVTVLEVHGSEYNLTPRTSGFGKAATCSRRSRASRSVRARLGPSGAPGPWRLGVGRPLEVAGRARQPRAPQTKLSTETQDCLASVKYTLRKLFLVDKLNLHSDTPYTRKSSAARSSTFPTCCQQVRESLAWPRIPFLRFQGEGKQAEYQFFHRLACIPWL